MKCCCCNKETTYNYGSRNGSYCKECASKGLDKIEIIKCSSCSFDFIITLDTCPNCGAIRIKHDESCNQDNRIFNETNSSTPSKKCTKCGKENCGDSLFCSKCGKSLSSNESKTKSRFNTVSIITIVVLSIIFINFFIYYLFKPARSAEKESEKKDPYPLKYYTSAKDTLVAFNGKTSFYFKVGDDTRYVFTSKSTISYKGYEVYGFGDTEKVISFIIKEDGSHMIMTYEYMDEPMRVTNLYKEKIP